METKQKGSPFSQLPKEKKERILQAAIEVFAQNDYKHASTDEIASRAGISKGLLFYYFHDKKTLYFYLGEYLKRMIENHLKKEVLMGIDDFFDLLDYGIEGKLKLFEKMPWVLEFSVRMYYNTEKDISPVIKKYIVSMTNQMYDLYFSHVDTSRFREGVSPREVLQTLIFLTDGYLHWQLMSGGKIELKPLMQEYARWKQMMIGYAYKEEYQR